MSKIALFWLISLLILILNYGRNDNISKILFHWSTGLFTLLISLCLFINIFTAPQTQAVVIKIFLGDFGLFVGWIILDPRRRWKEWRNR